MRWARGTATVAAAAEQREEAVPVTVPMDLPSADALPGVRAQ